MASRLRLPTLAIAGLSFCLSTAILGCAARTFAVFQAQRSWNPWFLPLWPDHFDNRGLDGLIGTSAAIIVLNGILIAAVFVRKVSDVKSSNRCSCYASADGSEKQLPTNLIVLVSALCSSVAALVGLAFQGELNGRAPARDTLQTWTCNWRTEFISEGYAAPRDFDTLCQQTSFAYYTTIPVLMLQLLLVGLSCYAIFTHGHMRTPQEVEKGHELRDSESENEVGCVSVSAAKK